MPRRSGAAATLMPRIGAAPSAMLVVSLLLSWGLVNARVRAQEVQRIEMAPPGTDRIEPRNDPPMRIEARNDPPPRSIRLLLILPRRNLALFLGLIDASLARFE